MSVEAASPLSERSQTPDTSMAQRLAQRRLERSNSRSNTPRNQLDPCLSNRGSSSQRNSGASPGGRDSPTPKKPSTALSLDALSLSKQQPKPSGATDKGLVALGNLSARDFIAKGMVGASKPSDGSTADQPLVALGNLSARDFISRGLDVHAGSRSGELEVELGQLSARAFIAAGLEKTTVGEQKTKDEVDLGQLSARNFIGMGVQRASKGTHGGSTAGATTGGETDDFAQLTARSAITAGISLSTREGS